MTNNSVKQDIAAGGAIAGTNPDDNVIAENCSFEGNSAQHGGAIYLRSPAGLTANNCTFSDNSAVDYGAVYTGIITLDACTFSGNRATEESGAVAVKSGGTIINCLFFNNIVDNPIGDGHGGAIHHIDSALTPPNAELRIVNCTFASNEVRASGSMSNSYYCAIFGYGNTKVTNCILWGNIASLESQIDGSSVVNYSDVQGGLYAGTNYGLDPIFAGPVPYASVNSLKLTPLSPPEVTQGGTFEGAPSVDFDGHIRTKPYSMGAFEKD